MTRLEKLAEKYEALGKEIEKLRDEQNEIEPGTLCYFWDEEGDIKYISKYKTVDNSEGVKYRYQDYLENAYRFCKPYDKLYVPWKKHTGDSMPVDDFSGVIVKTNDNTVKIGIAGTLSWTKKGRIFITHYYVVK